MSWEEVIDFPNYEIWTEYPYQIRKKSNQRILKESIHKCGYVHVNLHQKSYSKHIIVAKQFIPNPENYEFVDHINRVKTDFRVENLRWVSRRMNNNNQERQTFVDEIPDDCIWVEEYNGWNFDFLYFDPDTDTFYYYNGINYVVKPKYQNRNGAWRIGICDLTGRKRNITYNKFKKLYGLI